MDYLNTSTIYSERGEAMHPHIISLRSLRLGLDHRQYFRGDVDSPDSLALPAVPVKLLFDDDYKNPLPA